MENLLWNLLGWGVLPLWLASGVADYLCHLRTDLARTSGVHESALHLLQTAEIGMPMLAFLFLEPTTAVLGLMVLGVVLHTLSAYRDLRWSAPRRRIPVFEQFVHAFLIVLPVVALVIVAVLHWPRFRLLFDPFDAPAGAWALRLRDVPFDAGVVATVLAASLVLGVLPGIAEFVHAWRTRAMRVDTRHVDTDRVDTKTGHA